MRLFLIWNLSLAILLGFANQELRLFGMILIAISAWPAWSVLAKGVADAAVQQFVNRLNARRAKNAAQSPANVSDPLLTDAEPNQLPRSARQGSTPPQNYLPLD